MSSRKPRGLRSDEEELWRRVARTTTPLNKRRATSHSRPTETPIESKPVDENTFEIKPFQIGSRATTALSEGGAIRSAASLSMDQRTYQRLKRGKLRPEARIDLHGMTADAAHAEVSGFLFRAHAAGKRLVLVITGKGRGGDETGPMPMRTGVLRRALPDWLQRPPLSTIVQQVTEAHHRHGGSGAFYVYLRRVR